MKIYMVCPITYRVTTNNPRKINLKQINCNTEHKHGKAKPNQWTTVRYILMCTIAADNTAHNRPSTPFSKPFSRWTWISRFPSVFFLQLFRKRTNGTKWHRFLMDWTPFVIHNQQRQSTSIWGNYAMLVTRWGNCARDVRKRYSSTTNPVTANSIIHVREVSTLSRRGVACSFSLHVPWPFLSSFAKVTVGKWREPTFKHKYTAVHQHGRSTSSWDGRPFGHNRHGPKSRGLLCHFPWGEGLGPRLTQYGLRRGLPPYQ